MKRADEIADTYGDGEWLRRWTLAEDGARCRDDAFHLPSTAPAQLAAQRAANAGVRAALAAVEAYEAALAVAQGDEPPADCAVLSENGIVTAPNPAWIAWAAARRAVAAATSEVIALHRRRQSDNHGE